MKKVFLFLLAFVAMVAEAQTKGNFEVLDLGSFKLHVYNTNDALGDASYIIEGKTGLVTLEQPLFKDNVSEFDTYVVSLNKPVQKIITNYHVGGTGNHNVVMIEGMPDFVKGAVYGGMMQNFAKIFGDAITPVHIGNNQMKEERIKGTFFFHRASRLHKNRFPKRNQIQSRNFGCHSMQNNGYIVATVHQRHVYTLGVPVRQPVLDSSTET